MSWFLPKEKNFHNLFKKQAIKITESVVLFGKLKNDYEQILEVAKRAKILENEADKIVHQIIEKLLHDHTRTSEEKEVIKLFAQNMDDVVDCIEKAINRLKIYHIKIFPQELIGFISILKDMSREIEHAVDCLSCVHKSRCLLAEHCVRINKLENDGDDHSRGCLEKILNNNELADREVFKLKEIIEILERSLDKCEDVANILETFSVQGGV